MVPHIKAFKEVLDLQGIDGDETESDNKLKTLMKDLVAANVNLQPEAWLPEFEVDKLASQLNARSAALSELERLASSLEPAKIASALQSASDAGILRVPQQVFAFLCGCGGAGCPDPPSITSNFLK